MAYSNNITKLVNKIERRAGLLPLTPHLPDTFGKEEWCKVIIEDSLVTFSRYYAYKFKYIVDSNTPRKNGRWYINEDLIGGAQILGVQDLDWADFANNSISIAQQFGYGLPDMGAMNFSMDDITDLAIRANYASLFNNGIYINFYYPNMIELKSIGNNNLNLSQFAINLLLVHPDNLTTIPPTQMETFEALAQADVCGFLYNNLKYYDGMETVFATLDLKLGDLQNEYSKREGIVEKLEANYVTAGNDAVPIIITTG